MNVNVSSMGNINNCGFALKNHKSQGSDVIPFHDSPYISSLLLRGRQPWRRAREQRQPDWGLPGRPWAPRTVMSVLLPSDNTSTEKPRQWARGHRQRDTQRLHSKDPAPVPADSSVDSTRPRPGLPATTATTTARFLW